MKRIFLIASIGCAVLVPAFAQYPTLVAGIGLEPFLLPDASGTPVLFWTLGAEGIFSLKALVGKSGSFSLYAKVKGGVLLDEPVLGLDAESLSAELDLEAGEGRLVLKALSNSSLLGTMTGEIVFHPEWEARYYFLTAAKKINPYIAYTGFLRLRPESATDIFSEGAEIGFEYRPSFLEEYRVSLQGGWDDWYESPIYLSGGIPGTSVRNDFLMTLSSSLGGIIGLFLDWDIGLSLALRLSNANRYLDASSYLDEDSESAATVSLKPAFDWVPLKSLALKIKPMAGYTVYFHRRAVSSGVLLEDRAFVFTAGGEFEFDWMPAEALHFILKLEGEWRCSNDDELNEWRVQASVGMKISFDFL